MFSFIIRKLASALLLIEMPYYMDILNLFYAKIVKGEYTGKAKKLLFICIDFAEPHPIFYKDNEKV